MAAVNTDGLRRRDPVLDEKKKSPVDSTTVKVESKHDKQTNVEEHPGGSAHGPFLQGARVVALVLYFLGSCVCMNTTQFLGAPLYFYDTEWYYAWMAVIKQHFTLLLVTMQQWWTPTVVRVSGDASVRGQLTQASDGRLECDFPERMILISNHNLYTDWLYLWWISYTARMHGHIFIILKESLKYVPILGWGMQFFSFIFLSRNWTKDRERFAHRLGKLKRKQNGGAYNPMWMLIFPEGTNVSKNSRDRSKAWAAKQGVPDLQHALLPRSTGLLFCLQELGDTVEWVYDCTLAYEGIGRGEFGQDVFPLRSMYLQGLIPKSVNMYWRRFAVRDIPVSDATAFDAWVQARWREKDALLEHYIQHGRFPADEEVLEHKPIPNGAGITKPVRNRSYIETEVKPASPFEILQIFVPIALIALGVNLVRKFWGWLLVALMLRSK